ncbi:hypothetical protein OIO90_005622 [Microbotryomycetes sp. JL221]|nr:hypothetical protein OIO90_005622 [Microbotryomycetes sp. JL221]
MVASATGKRRVYESDEDELLIDTQGEANLSVKRGAQDVPAKKKPRVGVACNACRQKRIRCDGVKPTCSACATSQSECEFLINSDRRKPFTKAMVQALQLRIDTLEQQLKTANAKLGLTDTANLAATNVTVNDVPEQDWRNATSADAQSVQQSASVGLEVQISRPGTSHGQRGPPIDAFSGGLALNSHGELRYYGPTSSYRAVLADAAAAAASNETVEAIRAFSLTRAPIPAAVAAPAEPALPRRPPDLAPELKAKMFSLAFEHCFSQFDLVPKREFLHDSEHRPFERTSNSSPFLINCVLAIGSRYLESDEVPEGACSIASDLDTRGDVFATYARHLLDQELYSPALSTIRGLIVLGMYLAMRGFDGPCTMFTGQAFRLVEDFGLHLGVHRLTVGKGFIPDELINARRNMFWTAHSTDLATSIFIGRKVYFPPDHIDIDMPLIVSETDYEEPLYRSSAFHWNAQLSLIGGRIMHKVYSLRSDVSFEKRQQAVPDLHLQLEQWYHALPSHLRVPTSDPGKAKMPHQHVIALNMFYSMLHIQLHRPFFRRHSKDPTTNVSTEKCLVAAAGIVRLIKLLKKGSGLRLTAPGVQHSAFCAGTILAISAAENRISDNPKQDRERRVQAQKDLGIIVEALKEMGKTWTTAHTSATVLEALMAEWSSQPVQQTAVPSSQQQQSTNGTSEQTGARVIGQEPSILVDDASLNEPNGMLGNIDPMLSSDLYQTFRDVVDFEPPSASAASSFPFLFPSWQLEDSPPQHEFDLFLNTPT